VWEGRHDMVTAATLLLIVAGVPGRAIGGE
jgi:hypothetical protein